MSKIVMFTLAALTLLSATLAAQSDCKDSFRNCPVHASPASRDPTTAPQGPECCIELTCTNGPIQLGHCSGVCFRASCPGVWGIIHERMDQASFRRRLFTYRHYTFKGYWELKDQGVIEAGLRKQRELFLVMPDDLIEFRLLDPDPCAKIELRELGYIKKGCVEELQRWLAYWVYMEKAEQNYSGSNP